MLWFVRVKFVVDVGLSLYYFSSVVVLMLLIDSNRLLSFVLD